MSHATATGHYFPNRTLDNADNDGLVSPLTDRYGASDPRPIHLFLAGLVADDLQYVTNEIVDGVFSPEQTNFQFERLPSGITALTLKLRFYNPGTAFDVGAGNNNSVQLFQGEPTDGTGLEVVKFPDDVSGWNAITVNVAVKTWFTITKTIDISNITDLDNIWIHCRFLRGNPTLSRCRMSWATLLATFPFGRGETPTSKNYVNTLSKLGVVSVRQEGTKGTSTYCYRVVPCDSDGVCGGAADEVKVTDGNATLDSTDHISLSWLDITGAANYKVYRTCSPSGLGLGLLATVLPNLGAGGSGGGGGGDTGYKDDGTQCITDCAELFSESLCQEVTTVTYGSKETPT